MPAVARNRGAVLEVVDATATPKTHEIYPQEGDWNFTTAKEVTEYKHRGVAIADGEGMFADDSTYIEGTFSFMLHDLTDAIKSAALIDWMRGNEDSTADAFDSASWTATTTRTDGQNTLHFRYWPQGKGTGKRYYQIDDAIVSSFGMAEGAPTVFNVTVKSTTKLRETSGFGT